MNPEITAGNALFVQINNDGLKTVKPNTPFSSCKNKRFRLFKIDRVIGFIVGRGKCFKSAAVKNRAILINFYQRSSLMKGGAFQYRAKEFAVAVKSSCKK